MPMLETTKARRETLNLRIKSDLRGLIDRAAQVTGKTRTDFVLHAARNAAQEVLIDQTVFALDPKAHAEFLARLDQPPRPNDRLRRALETAAPWEE